MSCYTQYGNLMITLTQQTWTRKSKRLRNAKPFLNLFGLILSSENLLQYFQIRFRNAEKWKFFNLISQICLSSNRFLSFTDFRYQLYVVNWTPIYMSKWVISGSPGLVVFSLGSQFIVCSITRTRHSVRTSQSTYRTGFAVLVYTCSQLYIDYAPLWIIYCIYYDSINFLSENNSHIKHIKLWHTFPTGI